MRRFKTPPVMITRRQPHRNGGADQIRLRPQEGSHRRTLPTRTDPAHRFQGAGRGRGGRGADRANGGGCGEEKERGERAEPQAHEEATGRTVCGFRSIPSARSGKPGEQIQSVVSVGMLSEGWDAKTVTHIMGLRAFTSQLLCEQVVGRGLRRTAYELNPETGLFDPEYVNIFGVPFTFLPHESKKAQSRPRRNPRQRSSRLRPKRCSKYAGRTSSASITFTGPDCPSIGKR